MKIDYLKIKKFLHIGIFSFDLLAFLIVETITSTKNKNYKSYTDCIVFFLDIYIIAIYLILILNTINPKILYPKISKYLTFIFHDKGKVIISFLIDVIYWFASNGPQFSLSVLLFITSVILLIYEFIFYFSKVEKFFQTKGIEFTNKENKASDFVIGGNISSKSGENNTQKKEELSNNNSLNNKNIKENNKNNEGTSNNQNNNNISDNNHNNPVLVDETISDDKNNSNLEDVSKNNIEGNPNLIEELDDSKHNCNENNINNAGLNNQNNNVNVNSEMTVKLGANQ